MTLELDKDFVDAIENVLSDLDTALDKIAEGGPSDNSYDERVKFMKSKDEFVDLLRKMEEPTYDRI